MDQAINEACPLCDKPMEATADGLWCRDCDCGIVDGLEARIDKLEEALHKIARWSMAYPKSIWPELSEDEWVRARDALKEAGLSIDSISASCMRHVVEGVGKIAKEALE